MKNKVWETANFLYNFVHKTNATEQLWLHFLPTSKRNFLVQFSPVDSFEIDLYEETKKSFSSKNAILALLSCIVWQDSIGHRTDKLIFFASENSQIFLSFLFYIYVLQQCSTTHSHKRQQGHGKYHVTCPKQNQKNPVAGCFHTLHHWYMEMMFYTPMFNTHQ